MLLLPFGLLAKKKPTNENAMTASIIATEENSGISGVDEAFGLAGGVADCSGVALGMELCGVAGLVDVGVD